MLGLDKEIQKYTHANLSAENWVEDVFVAEIQINKTEKNIPCPVKKGLKCGTSMTCVLCFIFE